MSIEFIIGTYTLSLDRDPKFLSAGLDQRPWALNEKKMFLMFVLKNILNLRYVEIIQAVT